MATRTEGRSHLPQPLTWHALPAGADKIPQSTPKTCFLLKLSQKLWFGVCFPIFQNAWRLRGGREVSEAAPLGRRLGAARHPLPSCCLWTHGWCWSQIPGKVFPLTYRMALPVGLHRMCGSLCSKWQFALLVYNQWLIILPHGSLSSALFSSEVLYCDVANDFEKIFLKLSVHRSGAFWPRTYPSFQTDLGQSTIPHDVTWFGTHTKCSQKNILFRNLISLI